MSADENSAHRSSSGGRLDIATTIKVDVLSLAPKWTAIARKWWDPRPRIMIEVRARRMGRVARTWYWREGSARRRVQAFLDSHRRIYHRYAQPAQTAA